MSRPSGDRGETRYLRSTVSSTTRLLTGRSSRSPASSSVNADHLPNSELSTSTVTISSTESSRRTSEARTSTRASTADTSERNARVASNLSPSSSRLSTIPEQSPEALNTGHCIICQDPFTDDGPPRGQPMDCGHDNWHVECITHWLAVDPPIPCPFRCQNTGDRRTSRSSSQASRLTSENQSGSVLRQPSGEPCYVSPAGMRYHRSADCDGLRNARSTRLTNTAALPANRDPCRLCWNSSSPIRLINISTSVTSSLTSRDSDSYRGNAGDVTRRNGNSAENVPNGTSTEVRSGEVCYVSPFGKKYHRIQNCYGLRSARSTIRTNTASLSNEIGPCLICWRSSRQIVASSASSTSLAITPPNRVNSSSPSAENVSITEDPSPQRVDVAVENQSNATRAERTGEACYVAPRGSRYHRTQNCAGLANAQSYRLGDTSSLPSRMTPCRICWTSSTTRAQSNSNDRTVQHVVVVESNSRGTAQNENARQADRAITSSEKCFLTPSGRRYHRLEECVGLSNAQNIIRSTVPQVERRLRPCHECW